MTYFNGEAVQKLRSIIAKEAETNEDAAELLEGFDKLPYLNVMAEDIQAVAEDKGITLSEEEIEAVQKKIQRFSVMNYIGDAIQAILEEQE